ncbi:hypothetical protein T484DRAFT_1756461 [Baffinella frigidus]|nr:hypothetical protein T484DRAFT_1756461 [Cryptophyta sp. CCMP2293]
MSAPSSHLVIGATKILNDVRMSAETWLQPPAPDHFQRAPRAAALRVSTAGFDSIGRRLLICEVPPVALDAHASDLSKESSALDKEASDLSKESSALDAHAFQLGKEALGFDKEAWDFSREASALFDSEGWALCKEAEDAKEAKEALEAKEAKEAKEASDLSKESSDLDAHASDLRRDLALFGLVRWSSIAVSMRPLALDAHASDLSNDAVPVPVSVMIGSRNRTLEDLLVMQNKSLAALTTTVELLQELGQQLNNFNVSVQPTIMALNASIKKGIACSKRSLDNDDDTDANTDTVACKKPRTAASDDLEHFRRTGGF